MFGKKMTKSEIYCFIHKFVFVRVRRINRFIKNIYSPLLVNLEQKKTNGHS